MIFKTDINDMINLFDCITVTKAVSVLDCGLSLMGNGLIGKQLGDMMLPDRLVLDGLAGEIPDLPVYRNVYDEIHLPPYAASGRYDLGIALSSYEEGYCILTDCCRFILTTARTADAHECFKSIRKRVPMDENDPQYLILVP